MPKSVPPLRAVSATACLIASSVALGLAVQIADGFYDPTALVVVALALVLTVVGLWLGPHAPDHGRGQVMLRAVLAAGIACQVYSLLTKSPGMYLQEGARVDLFRAGVLVQAILAAAGVIGIRALSRWWFPGILAVSLMLGSWMLTASPDPRIDVVEVHESAFRALGRGRNPYRMTFRNIYGDTRFYSPAAVSGDRVLFGYPYPPLSLLLAAPGQLVFKDYRYAQLAAAVAAAAAMAYAGGSLVARLAAVLWLTTPRLYFVLEQGWTEPVAALMLALTMASMVRRPRWAAWSGGLLIVTKQYVALAAPLLWRFGSASPEGPIPFAGRAVLAGSVVTLPFALWNVQAFLETVVLLQTREPFRIDSLSFVSWAARMGWGEASYLWAVGAALTGVAVAVWRAPNTAAGFCAGLALSTLAMFSLGSKAFCNYYVFVIGALCCSVAAAAARPMDVLDTRRSTDQTA